MKILTELILHFIRNTFLGKFVVITCVITSNLELCLFQRDSKKFFFSTKPKKFRSKLPAAFDKQIRQYWTRTCLIASVSFLRKITKIHKNRKINKMVKIHYISK